MRNPHFSFVSETVDLLLKDYGDFDVARIYYNAYVNSSTYNLKYEEVYPLSVCEKIQPTQLMAYELEGDEAGMIQDLMEFKFASTVYRGMAENSCSENGSRLKSMDGAVSACKEKSEEYEKIYQKLRKTKITSELTVLAAGVMCLAEAE